jgi:cyclopropane fatty-acyl-phospholipid synthase-like methyltransferase
VPTPQDVVEKMLAVANPQKTDVVIDLGSGDGRIVIAAAKTYDCKVIGYELDRELVESSRVQATKSGVEELVVFEHKDLFEADLTNVQVVTLYLLPKQLETLLPKLRQLKPGARIVAHQFPLLEREGAPLLPDRTVVMQSTEDGDTHTIYLWTTPLKVDARK